MAIKSENINAAISETMRRQVASLLGRSPRGLEAVAVQSPDGRPQVIRVASLVEEKPFPTMFWLVDPDLCYEIDQLEAGGLIARLQARVDAQSRLRDALRADHLAHIQLRRDYMSATVRRQLHRLNYMDVMVRKGIGGISDFTRIRCLHTWYAAHLVVPNAIGQLLEHHWQVQRAAARVHME